MKIHPAAALFPMLANEEMALLAKDIADNGQIEAIVLWQGEILDGRCRLAACEIAGVEPRFIELDQCPSPAQYVISANIRRRHLEPGQRSTLAALAVDLFKKEAAERQRAAGAAGGKKGGRPKKNAGAKNPSGQSSPKGFSVPAKSKKSDDGKATKQAAKATGAGVTNTRLMTRMRKVAPDLFAKVHNGEMSVAQAERERKRRAAATQPPVQRAIDKFADDFKELAQLCQKVARIGIEIEDEIEGITITGLEVTARMGDLLAASDVLQRLIAMFQGQQNRMEIRDEKTIVASLS